MNFRNYPYPLSIVVGVDEHGGFAKDGKIPWNFPSDLKKFKETTMGGVCIMGRHTYNDMVGMFKTRGKEVGDEILEGRKSIVLSHNTKKLPGVESFDQLSKAVQSIPLIPNNDPEIFIIGGERLFLQALPFTTRVYMTIIPGDYHCDKFFPIDYVHTRFRIESGELLKGDLKFVKYVRTHP